MNGRLRLLRDATILVVVAVASLAWLRARAPAESLPAPLETADLPAAASCQGTATSVDRPRIDSSVAIECPEQFDGKVVTYTGEVVGDVLEREGGAWVQLNDDEYALAHGPLSVAGVQAGTNSGLAVWLPSPADQDLLAGRSRQRGHVLTVTGTFLRADPRDGGGTTIRAESVEVRDEGRPLDVSVPRATAVLAIALLLAAAELWRRHRSAPF